MPLKKQFCPRGHDTHVVGRSSNRRCKECNRESTRKWKVENPEKLRENERKWGEDPQYRRKKTLYMIDYRHKRKVAKYGDQGLALRDHGEEVGQGRDRSAS